MAVPPERLILHYYAGLPLIIELFVSFIALSGLLNIARIVLILFLLALHRLLFQTDRLINHRKWAVRFLILRYAVV